MIELVDIQKSFRGQPVLAGVSLDIPAGKITVIIGPSGCGKTVLLRHIIGLLRPDRGEIRVDGEVMGQMTSREMNRFRQRFGMLFQNAALFDSMTVFENVAFPLVERYRGKKLPDVKALVREKLRLVGLSGIDEKMPSELSGGMRKRVGLARAIILDPQIILYDEPTTGLDPIMTRAIDDLILSTQRALGVTSVVISHDIPSAMRIADEIAMMHGGRVIAHGAPAEFARSKEPVVREFLKAGGSLADETSAKEPV